MINLKINAKPIQAAEGTTIIDAAKANNINIPNLCYLQGVHKFGTCRICVVEVKGAKTLQASCMTEVVEGMEVFTNTLRVRNARKVLYELLLSDHSKECLSCSRNQNCELQQLGRALNVDDTRFEGERPEHIIDVAVSVTRDMTKCILCRRCVTACNEIQGVGAINAQNRGFETVISPAMDLPLGDVNCMFCGQCTVVCPVGALKETDGKSKAWQGLFDPGRRKVVQVAPAVRVAIGEEFGLPAGSRVTGKLAAALRALGFDDVFDTNFTADLTILEEGTELLTRLKKALSGEEVTLPMITSCSPGWVKYIEHTYPEKLEHLSTCKAPHTMLGALVKSYYADKIKVDPKDMFVVSVMPCTAKKFEIERSEMQNNGVPNVDVVITTRELADMIKEAGIDFNSLPDEDFDHPLGLSTGAADIFGLTGGVMEAALRTVYELVTGRELPFDKLHVTPIVGLDRVKSAEILIEKPLEQYSLFDGVTVRVAVTSGAKGASQLLKEIAEGTSPYHFIEIMGCPGGCIMGGGQPRSADTEVRQKRLKGLYLEDEEKVLRKSHENPYVISLYEEFLGIPNGHKSHELLHTHYVKRGKFNQFTDESFAVEVTKPAIKKAVKETPPKERVSTELESIKVLALEGEIARLKRECEEYHETVELFKKIISDSSKSLPEE
jgi:NADH-quinone oxidoreductase subunit G/NADP-reducing hydrogenase subunit HndD